MSTPDNAVIRDCTEVLKAFLKSIDSVQVRRDSEEKAQ